VPRRRDLARLTDQVEARLEGLIARGTFALGSRMPSERELGRRLEVSRPVVREAIGRLESRGFLRVYPSKGTYVTGTPEGGVKAPWQAWVVKDRDKVLALLEVRECLEERAAALAVERASEDDLAELRLAHLSFEQQSSRGSIPDLSHWDKVFHQQLAACSHNDVLASFAQNINTTITASRRSMFSLPGSVERSLNEHALILEAVEARDADAAVRAVAAHIGRVREELAQLSESQASLAAAGVQPASRADGPGMDS
jgi:DNA-binding FadR family transcriptional regulator